MLITTGVVNFAEKGRRTALVFWFGKYTLKERGGVCMGADEIGN